MNKDLIKTLHRDYKLSSVMVQVADSEAKGLGSSLDRVQFCKFHSGTFA